MSQKTLDVRQKQKYDTSTNWATNNPVLLAGEIGIESDTNKIKIGDGSTSWNNLSYSDADVVHKTGNEDVGGTKTFLGQQRVKKASEGGGYFYVTPDGNGYNAKLGFSSGGQMMIHNGGFQIDRNLYPMAANSNLDLGTSSILWRDLYLKGSLKDNNGNDIAIADIANKTDILLKPLTLSTTTMTDEQIATLRAYNCVLTNDLTLGNTSLKAGTILTVPFEYSNSLRGMVIYNNKIMTYYINLTTKTIGDGAQDIVISNVANIQTGKVTIDNYTINKDNFGQLQIGNNNATSMQFDGGTVRAQNLVPIGNNLKDLGNSSQKWKDLYLAGNLTDGTDSVSVSEIQKKLTAGTNITIDSNNVISATGGGTATDVKVDGTSITSNNEADIQTINGDYDASTNKLATEADLPDISGKQNSTDNSLDTTSKTVVGAINEVNSIAKQANIAKSFASYSALITELNSEASTTYKVGQSFYIETLNVPDLWVISVESSSSSYTYVDDATFVTATAVSGGQQVGYYKLGQLETQKVDISTKMDKADPTGTGSFSLNRKENTTIGLRSVAVGYNTTASANNSFAQGNGTTASFANAHAEGQSSVASGSAAHAEGFSTDATGWYSHAEGNQSTASSGAAHAEGEYTTASGDAAHAEGRNTTASGSYSHAEGYYTTSQRKSQHVFGEYNILDNGGSGEGTRGTYVEIVGNGTAGSSRSNARTLDWSGNEELAGNIIVKGGKIGDGKNANYKLAIPDTTSWTADKTIATTDQMPTELAELGDDSTHRLVTDTEKSTWNGKQDAITSTNKLDYSLLANTPTIPDTSNFVQKTGAETISGEKTFQDDIILNHYTGISSNEIETGNTNRIFGVSDYTGGTALVVGHPYVNLRLRGSQTRPLYGSSELALLSDVASKADLNNASQNIYANDIILQGYSMFDYCANLAKVTYNNAGTNGDSNRSYYATWRIDIGPIKIIGGATPSEEGFKTINFRMNNATGTDVFSTACLTCQNVGRYRSSSTGNGWQYCRINSKSNCQIVQISDGSFWMAIGY